MKLENFLASIERLFQKRTDHLSFLLDCYAKKDMTEDKAFGVEFSFYVILREENKGFDILQEKYSESLEKIKKDYSISKDKEKAEEALRDLRLEVFMRLDHLNDLFLCQYHSWCENLFYDSHENVRDMYNASTLNNTEHHQEIDNGLVVPMIGVFMPQDNCG